MENGELKVERGKLKVAVLDTGDWILGAGNTKTVVKE
jgi:hypothetical protein